MSRLSLDHVVIAAADLDTACAEFAAATGCMPVPGGPHLGLGTRNALASFGDGVYLEIIAPDPEQPPGENLAAQLAKLPEPELFHWALRTRELEALGDALRTAGLAPTPAMETHRKLPSGETLTWDLMGLPGKDGAWPFFIDWRGCPHPSQAAPRAGALRHFRACIPVEDPNALAFAAASGVELASGVAQLSLAFESERGLVTWRRDGPRGFFA